MGWFTSKQEDKFRAFARANGANYNTALLYASLFIRGAKKHGMTPDVLLHEAEIDLSLALTADPEMFIVTNTLPDWAARVAIEMQIDMIINRIESGERY